MHWRRHREFVGTIYRPRFLLFHDYALAGHAHIFIRSPASEAVFCLESWRELIAGHLRCILSAAAHCHHVERRHMAYCLLRSGFK